MQKSMISWLRQTAPHLGNASIESLNLNDSDGPWFSCISESHCCMSLIVGNTSLILVSSVTLAISRYEWIISSFLVVPSGLLAGSWVFQVNQVSLMIQVLDFASSFAVSVSRCCSAWYFFELYWSCCHWAVVSDSLLWVGSHWLMIWSPWACIWLQLLPFISSGIYFQPQEWCPSLYGDNVMGTHNPRFQIISNNPVKIMQYFLTIIHK